MIFVAKRIILTSPELEQDAAKEEAKGTTPAAAAEMDLDQFLDGGFMAAAGSDDEELMSSDDSLDGEGGASDDEETEQLPHSAAAAPADESSSDGAWPPKPISRLQSTPAHLLSAPLSIAPLLIIRT